MTVQTLTNKLLEELLSGGAAANGLHLNVYPNHSPRTQTFQIDISPTVDVHHSIRAFVQNTLRDLEAPVLTGYSCGYNAGAPRISIEIADGAYDLHSMYMMALSKILQADPSLRIEPRDTVGNIASNNTAEIFIPASEFWAPYANEELCEFLAHLRTDAGSSVISNLMVYRLPANQIAIRLTFAEGANSESGASFGVCS